MAGEDLLTYTGQASIAYQDALNQAKNTQNALLRQYGFVAPTGTGDYSIQAAQAGFDPNTLFDKATGGINQANLQKAVSGLAFGGGGILGETVGAGTAGEAEAATVSRARFGEGITGGLAAQARQTAETAAREQYTGAKEQFVAGIGEALSPIGGAFRELEVARAQARADEELARAAAATLPQTPEEEAVAEAAEPKDSIFGTGKNAAGGILPSGSRGNYKIKGEPKGNVPKKKPGQTFTGSGGIRWVYRPSGPSGAGWYKKK